MRRPVAGPATRRRRWACRRGSSRAIRSSQARCSGPCAPGSRRSPALPVWNVAAHDTASAFVAAPVVSAHSAILSSGTWSLLGVEVASPVLDRTAAAFNLTNERGIDGSIRLLRNVMGLWLLQECRRHWSQVGLELDYAELEAAGRPAERGRPAVRPRSSRAAPLGRHAVSDRPHSARQAGEPAPQDPGQFVRAILTSLACKYNLVLRRLELVTGRRFDTIHVIGGGARNRVLCQLTADLTGLPVIAGPIEATALGNILVQARAAGHLGSLAEIRQVVSSACQLEHYEPAVENRAAARLRAFHRRHRTQRLIPGTHPRLDMTNQEHDNRAGALRAQHRNALMGLRRLRHSLRGVSAGRPTPQRLREARGRGRGAPSDRLGPECGVALPLGCRRRLRSAAGARGRPRAADRGRQPQPVPGSDLPARLDHAS